jgi:hypothetical protein
LSLVSPTVRGRTLLDEIRPTVLLYERRLLKGLNGPAFKKELDRLLDNAETLFEWE